MSENINTGSYLHAIARTDQYRDFQALSHHERAQHGDYFHARCRAIAMGSLALARERTTDADYRTPEGSMYNLIGHVDSFAHAAEVLDTDHDYIEEDSFHALKKDVAGFNHALKEAIEKNPAIGFNKLLVFLTQVYVSSNGSEGSRTFMDRARICLVGMQHEIAAEQIIDAVPGYEVDYDRDVTEEDDLHGVDILVRNLDMNRTIGVDIKATEYTVARKRQSDRHGHPERKIWSGCTNEDFGDAFRLNPTQVAEKVPILQRELDDAFAPLRSAA